MLATVRVITGPLVFPRLAMVEEGFCAVFRGDAGYDRCDGYMPGARHRAILRGKRFHYLYEGVDPAYPRLVPERVT